MLQTEPMPSISLLDLPEEPWANGGGATRTIAAFPDGTNWSWRLSLATLSSGAEFSSLPDVARIFTLASDGPVTFTLNGSVHELSLGMQAQFMGEDHVAVTWEEGTQYALNLMVRRGQGYGSVEVQRIRGRKVFPPTSLWHRTIVLTGQVHLDDGQVLGPLSVIHPADVELAVQAEDALIAHVVVSPTEG